MVKATLHRRSKPAPAPTPAPSLHSSQYGAIACCDGDVPVCTIQPTACVDNHLHPASVLCTGNCPNDDMTLKCTADMGSQCRLAHAATPIVYLQKPSYENFKLRQRTASSQGRLASLNRVVRGWYCAQLEPNTDPAPQHLEISTLEQLQATTDSASSKTSSTDETAAIKTHATANHDEPNHSDEAPQANTQPPLSVDNPTSPPQLPSIDASQSLPDFPGNENCDWVNENGECCDPSEGGYYRMKRQEQMNKLQYNKSMGGEVLNSTVPKAQVITYTRSTANISRPLTTYFPMEAPDMPIVEAVYVVLNTYGNQTDEIAFKEATESHTILLYSDATQTTTATIKPTHSYPPRPRANSKSDPRAGMKAGIAIGAIVVIAGVLFIFFHFRSRRKARQAALERDAQPGPTRGWGI